jgi:hypothetical protein
MYYPRCNNSLGLHRFILFVRTRERRSCPVMTYTVLCSFESGIRPLSDVTTSMGLSLSLSLSLSLALSLSLSLSLPLERISLSVSLSLYIYIYILYNIFPSWCIWAKTRCSFLYIFRTIFNRCWGCLNSMTSYIFKIWYILDSSKHKPLFFFFLFLVRSQNTITMTYFVLYNMIYNVIG